MAVRLLNASIVICAGPNSAAVGPNPFHTSGLPLRKDYFWPGVGAITDDRRIRHDNQWDGEVFRLFCPGTMRGCGR